MCGVLLAIAMPSACAHPAPPPNLATPAQPAPPELVVQQGPSSIMLSLAVDPANRVLASVSNDGMRLWDFHTGRILRFFPPLDNGRIDGGDVSFSADSHVLIDRNPGGNGRAFDVRTGAQIPLPAAAQPTAPPRCERPAMECVMAYAPDRRSAVTATESSSAMRQFENDVGARKLPPEYVELRAAPNGALIARWTTSSSYFCERRRVRGYEFCDAAMQYSRDGRHLAIRIAERTLAIADIDGRAKPRIVTFPDREPPGPGQPFSNFGSVETFAFTSDARTLVVGDDIGDLYSVDVRSGGMRNLWDVRDNPAQSGVSLSPNGQWLVTGVGSHSELWDLATGQPALNLNGACIVVFSPDSRRLACIEPHTLTVWNVGSGAPIASWFLRPPQERGRYLTLENKEASFSPDGSKLFTTLDAQPHFGAWTYRYAYVLDVATKKATRIGGTLNAGVTMGASAHGRYVSWLEFDGSVHRYDFQTATTTQIGRLPANAFSGTGHTLSGFSDGGVSPDGRYAVLLSNESVNNINIGYTVFDTVAQKTVDAPRHVGASLLGFSPDGGSALFADQDNTVSLVDLASGRRTHRYVGHTDRVSDAAFSTDGGTLVTAASDNTVRIWDVARERQLGTLFPGAGGPYDWLVVAPNGSFDGSPGGWNSILWRFGGQTFDVAEPEAFFNDFFDPGVVSALIRRREPSTATLATLDRRTPRIAVALLSKRSVNRTARVRVNASGAPPDAGHPAAGGARDIRLLRNGSLVHLWPGDALHGASSATLETTIKLTAGPNYLQAYAFNADGVRSSTSEVTITSSGVTPRRGKAYVLAIGVNRYANSNFSLRYASSDATAFASELRAQESRLYGTAYVDVTTLTDDRATKAGIRSALADLARRVQPEDVVYVYFAGHGVAYNDRYYLVPHDIGYTGPVSPIDTAGFDTILQHSISDLDLAQDVLPIDARKIVLVIDACESGEALGDAKIGPMNAKGLAQLAYDKGMYVLAASQGDQAALESSRYGHGLLTYALIEQALHDREAAAPESPGYLSLRQWLAFSESRVPELQLALMQSAERKGREIAVVPGEDRTISAAADRTLQRPRVFYPPYADSDAFVVATFPRIASNAAVGSRAAAHSGRSSP
jgi:WD40 repeat protein/uncharacterized caspase-like protein